MAAIPNSFSARAGSLYNFLCCTVIRHVPFLADLFSKGLYHHVYKWSWLKSDLTPFLAELFFSMGIRVVYCCSLSTRSIKNDELCKRCGAIETNLWHAFTTCPEINKTLVQCLKYRFTCYRHMLIFNNS